MPYTDVIVSLDCLNHYNPNLWALAKIKAYQMCKEPFIHVDGDVFIWTRIDECLKNHDLIVQNEETTSDYYREMWRYVRPAINQKGSRARIFIQNLPLLTLETT